MDSATRQAWLKKKKATSAEWDIYHLSIKFKRPFKNGDILRLYGTSKTNIRQHLCRMIAKGIIVRYAYQAYVPAVPK